MRGKETGPAPTQRRMTPVLEQAVLALRRRNLEEAARLADTALKADRSNLVAVEILGSALIELQKPEQALPALKKAARRSGDPVIEDLLARALFATGQTVEAIDQWRRATERRPPHPPAFLELSGALCAAGRYGEALSVLDQALNLTPTADGLRIALGHIHLKLNDRARARGAFEHVRAAAPGRRDAMVALAQLATIEGDYAEAAGLYRQALAKEPDDPPSRISLGKCLLELGRRDEGEAIIRRAIHDAPSFAPLAISALAGASHGRLFLRPSAALAFLGSASS